MLSRKDINKNNPKKNCYNRHGKVIIVTVIQKFSLHEIQDTLYTKA